MGWSICLGRNGENVLLPFKTLVRLGMSYNIFLRIAGYGFGYGLTLYEAHLYSLQHNNK